MKITQVTRHDIIDAFEAENVNWSGRLEEPAFLSRIFNLEELPSLDSRYATAAGDIRQHRVNNLDWEDDWVYYDQRFNLLNGDDEVFLRFVAELVHPVVRADSTESERLVQLVNGFLSRDGFQLVERTRISGRPVYVGRYVGISAVTGVKATQQSLGSTDPSYVMQQITRMEAAIVDDPALAIGTAKELVETCCKTILEERHVEHPKNDDLPGLVKLTAKTLELTPSDIPDKARAAETIKRLLSNLATITQGVAELRNHWGTGHGKVARTKGLQPRHARLAVGAASTLAVFLTETHNARGGGRFDS